MEKFETMSVEDILEALKEDEDFELTADEEIIFKLYCVENLYSRNSTGKLNVKSNLTRNMRRKLVKTPSIKRSIAKFSVEDFIAIMDKCSINEQLRGRKLHWYHLIIENQLTCPATEKHVAYCSYDVMEHPNPKVQPSYHFNFYTEDDEMFTIDHKMPRSLGGADATNNVQPMIGEINWRKGSELIYT